MIKIYQLVSISLKIQLRCCSHQWFKRFHFISKIFLALSKISEALQKMMVFKIYFQFFIVSNSRIIPSLFYFIEKGFHTFPETIFINDPPWIKTFKMLSPHNFAMSATFLFCFGSSEAIPQKFLLKLLFEDYLIETL